MVKVYVKFGEFNKTQTISVFEGLLEDRIVKIIMPTALYTTCQILSSYLNLSAFIVDGAIIGKDKNGLTLMKNVIIKIPLTFDKNIENYVSEVSIPKPRDREKGLKLPKWRRKK